jgi:2-amino-4-hydroxy-6-hydroxymethyldihydropteridine diphosphokinase
MRMPGYLTMDTMPTDSDHTAPLASPTGHKLKQVYLSLGSNLGNRVANTRKAIEDLDRVGIKVRRVSSFYKTEPVDFNPQAWFLNCVVEAATGLMPLQLLKAVKSVERAVGRRPGVSKGPRAIDIDILRYENVVVRSSALTIPHARMSERRFVLIPLRELAPGARHPVNSRTVTDMLYDSRDLSQVVRFKLEG